jgi:hypothetical protein
MLPEPLDKFTVGALRTLAAGGIGMGVHGPAGVLWGLVPGAVSKLGYKLMRDPTWGGTKLINDRIAPLLKTGTDSALKHAGAILYVASKEDPELRKWLEKNSEAGQPEEN